MTILRIAIVASVTVIAACGGGASHNSDAGAGGRGGSSSGGATSSAGGSGGGGGGSPSGGGATGSGGVTASGGGTTGSGGAPTMDAGASTDGGPETGVASRCTPGKYLVCESFESTAKGAIPTGWTRQGDATLSGVDDAEAARGAHALKLGAVMNGPRRIVLPATNFGGAHWGRIFYKVQLPAPKINGYLHSTMVALVGKNPQGTGDEEVRVVDTVEDPNGKHQFLYNVQPNGAEFGTGSDYLYKYDADWHCAEWHIDAADQSYHFYFDDKEITQIAKMNGAGKLAGTGIPDVFSTIEVGWYNYQAVTPGFVAWIDEVAIDETRIGCAN
ncbi:MAG TPA: hypothetical protein VHJ20_13600 [Polyangia bacterium]|nr:hypothetical protein [Polyangia bacterium]